MLLDDADFAVAVAAGVGAAYANSGQTCSALTRMIVPRSRLAEVEQIARETAESYTVGDPFAEGTRARAADLVGPARPRARLHREGHRRGRRRSSPVVADAPDGLDTGYFVKPTVFSNVTRDMTIAQEEIFGPVLSIIPYDTEEEAIEIANDTVYGLAAGVSGSDERARPCRAEAPRRSGARERRRAAAPAHPSAATSSRASDASTARTASRSSSR